MFLRSIRFRLTLWYALTLAVILAASGFFWHVYLARELLRQIDHRLLVIAEDVSSFSIREKNDSDICRELTRFRGSHRWGEYLQLRTGKGELLCLSSNLEDFQLPFSEAASQSIRSGKSHFETVESLSPSPIRMVTYPRGAGTEKSDEIVQVAESLTAMEDALSDLRLVFLTSAPLAIFALTFGGWFLAGRALAPVVRITNAVRRISAENLAQRLPVGETRDEISELEETFNSMLGRLEESFNKVKQFTGDASHELRTPLAILRGETEVALRWARDAEELRRTLESNMEEIDRMGRIIDDLLTLAKSEAGTYRLEITEFSLSDLLQDLYLQGRTLAEPKRIHFTLLLNVDEEIRILADQLQLHRVILNLISNAVKYTPEGGSVQVSLAVQDDQALVSVADTGIGIASEHLTQIFDRFYRVDEARNREVGGTGLGLAIVKWIVAAHGGRIEVDSTPGKGSVFTVFIPLHARQELRQPPKTL